MKKFSNLEVTILGALLANALVSAPAYAALTLVSACDKTLTTPDAVACAGYYSGNLLNGSASDIVNQKKAIASLPGDFVFDGNWDALDPEFKIESLSNIDQLDFGKTLFGSTIIGAHFGNVAGPSGNVSVFWLFDFGNDGVDFVSLDHTQGFSNAVLYTSSVGAVPEPSTWALMLLGFGAVGAAMRTTRRRLKTSASFA